MAVEASLPCYINQSWERRKKKKTLALMYQLHMESRAIESVLIKDIDVIDCSQ